MYPTQYTYHHPSFPVCASDTSQKALLDSIDSTARQFLEIHYTQTKANQGPFSYRLNFCFARVPSDPSQ